MSGPCVTAERRSGTCGESDPSLGPQAASVPCLYCEDEGNGVLAPETGVNLEDPGPRRGVGNHSRGSL